jgi:hypothetical protein
MFVVVAGKAADKVVVYGPFASNDEAIAWCQANMPAQQFRVHQVVSPTPAP